MIHHLGGGRVSCMHIVIWLHGEIFVFRDDDLLGILMKDRERSLYKERIEDIITPENSLLVLLILLLGII